VLAQENRVTTAADYRATVRGGKRVGTTHAVIYFAKRDPDAPTRFGFIVAKSVGGAVRRNIVRRRLKAIGYQLLDSVGTGSDVVVRALPGSDQVEWSTLQREIADAVERGVARR